MKSRIKKYALCLFFIQLGLFLLSLGFLYLYVATQDHPTFQLGACTVRDVLHIYCPGCGGSRGLLFLFTGHFLKAFEAYPAYLFAVLAFFVCDISLVVAVVKKREEPLRFIKWWYVLIFLAIAIIWAPVRSYLALRFGYDPLGDLTAISAVFTAPL